HMGQLAKGRTGREVWEGTTGSGGECGSGRQGHCPNARRTSTNGGCRTVAPTICGCSRRSGRSVGGWFGGWWGPVGRLGWGLVGLVGAGGAVRLGGGGLGLDAPRLAPRAARAASAAARRSSLPSTSG